MGLTSPKLGYDSATPPTKKIIQLLKPDFWGGYLGGKEAAVTWSKDNWSLLRDMDVEPLPIWVPKQDCSESSTSVAHEAIEAAQDIGMAGLIVIDTEESMSQYIVYKTWLDDIAHELLTLGWKSAIYAGAHYVPKISYIWNPNWDLKDVEVDSLACHQYSPNVTMDIDGTRFTVDRDIAGWRFPFAEWIK